MKILKIITSLICGAILFHIRYWEDENIVPKPFNKINFPGEFYKDWLYGNKEIIGLICTSILVLIPVLDSLNHYRKKEKAILSSIKSHFINSILGDPELNRITLFKKKYGYQIYPMFIWKCLIKNGISHYKKGLFLHYLMKTPLPHKEYLVQYSRSGQPHPNGSSTYFPISESEEDIEGFVSYTYLKERPKKIKLPKITKTDIVNKSEIKDCSKNKRPDIRKYMERSKLKDFKKLQTLHRLPTSMYADPVFFNDKKWGCLIFDSEDDSIDFEKKYLEFINYSKVILSVVSNLNTK